MTTDTQPLDDSTIETKRVCNINVLNLVHPPMNVVENELLSYNMSLLDSGLLQTMDETSGPLMVLRGTRIDKTTSIKCECATRRWSARMVCGLFPMSTLDTDFDSVDMRFMSFS